MPTSCQVCGLADAADERGAVAMCVDCFRFVCPSCLSDDRRCSLCNGYTADDYYQEKIDDLRGK